jgi:hypothetical protein
LSIAFGPAASPQGSADMLSGMTFGPYTSVGAPMSVLSFKLWDDRSGGNALMGSEFQTPLTFDNGGGVVIATLVVTLAQSAITLVFGSDDFPSPSPQYPLFQDRKTDYP